MEKETTPSQEGFNHEFSLNVDGFGGLRYLSFAAIIEQLFMMLQAPCALGIVS